MKIHSKPDVVMLASNPSTQEIESGRSELEVSLVCRSAEQVLEQGYIKKILLKKKRRKRKERN